MKPSQRYERHDQTRHITYGNGNNIISAIISSVIIAKLIVLVVRHVV